MWGYDNPHNRRYGRFFYFLQDVKERLAKDIGAIDDLQEVIDT